MKELHKFLNMDRPSTYDWSELSITYIWRTDYFHLKNFRSKNSSLLDLYLESRESLYLIFEQLNFEDLEVWIKSKPFQFVKMIYESDLVIETSFELTSRIIYIDFLDMMDYFYREILKLLKNQMFRRIPFLYLFLP